MMKELFEFSGDSSFSRTLCLLSNHLIASGSNDNSVNIWSLKEQRLVRTLHGHQSRVITVKALPNNRLASHSWDETIKIWNPHTDEGNLLKTMFGHGTQNNFLRMDILSNGFLVTCSCNDYEPATLRVWDPEKSKLIKSVSTQMNRLISLLVLANDQVAVGFSHKYIKILDLEDNAKSRMIEKC